MSIMTNEEMLSLILNKLESHDKRFDSMDKRFDSMDKRFDEVDKQLISHDKKFNLIENKFESQKDYIDSKLIALKTDIIEEVSKFHIEIISDIGRLDEKLSKSERTIINHAQLLKKVS